MMKQTFQFRVWIFDHLCNYNATHHIFLYHSSIYLLVFNLKHGSEGLYELKPWLDSIAYQAPYSSVIIIGTHLDAIHEQEKPDVDIIIQQARMIAAAYENNLESVSIIPVGLIKDRKVAGVKHAIQQCAANTPFLERGMHQT